MPDSGLLDGALSVELDRFGAELLAREEPDALTSDRALRLSQLTAAQAEERRTAVRQAQADPDRVGSVLAAFGRERGWSPTQAGTVAE